MLIFLFSEPACALFEIIAWHVFPEREKTCVDIYVDVFRALTLANNLLDKALMKLSISMFDIWLPSQHLVFVFDAPKWLLMRPAPVPALWNEKMLRRCTEPVAAVVPLTSGIQRALHLVVRIFARSQLELALFHSLHQVLLPDSAGVSLQLLQVTHTSLCVLIWGEIFIHLSSYPSAVEPQLSVMQTERRWEGHFLLSGDMSAQKLPAGTLEGREVWRSEGSCAFGAINLFFWVQEKHVAAVAGWSSQAWKQMYWLQLCSFGPDPLKTTTLQSSLYSDCFFCTRNQQ